MPAGSDKPSSAKSAGGARLLTSPLGLISWCLYDWANSAFSTIIITFVFAAYFTGAIAADPVSGTVQWTGAISASALVVAFCSPALGAIADTGGRRKPWLLVFTVICAFSCAMLWFAKPSSDWAVWSLFFVALGSTGFTFAEVFYNAMLPDIVPRSHIGRLSGWGWGLGYMGGLASLVIALTAFVQAETPLFSLDIANAEHIRATAVLVGLWYAVFALPLFLFTPDLPRGEAPLSATVRGGLKNLANTIRQVRKYRDIAFFLLAHMLYADGLATLFAIGGVYAAGTFDMDVTEVILFGIALNVSAGVGAGLFSWVDDWLGSKITILTSLAGLVLLGAAILIVEEKGLFWIFGVMLGVFVGPAQAASRSFMARLAPTEMRTQMFGLFAFSGKVTAFLGPILVGVLTAAFQSQRAGMAAVILLLFAGALLVLPVREPRQGETS